MYPLGLYMKDYCSHSETKFSFNDFSSALILGRIRGNEIFSNASGKSTIPNAIGYVVFNEIQFTTLERIIRRGADSCLVEFEFVSSLDNGTYKIARSLARKGGSDVALYRKENDEWKNISGRTSSQTEKEIQKVVGFNYRVFCASSLFVQPGAENNVQKDFGNMPALTVEKKKALLREILQLNSYNSYEKAAKKKVEAINSGIEKHNTLIQAVGVSEKDLDPLKEDHKKLEVKSQILSEELSEARELLQKRNLEFSKLKESSSSLIENRKRLTIRENELANGLSGYDDSLSKMKENAQLSSKEGKNLVSSIKKLEEGIKEISFDEEEYQRLLSQKHENQLLYAEKLAARGNFSVEAGRLSSPLPKGAECPTCHQELSESHREEWKKLSLIRMEEAKAKQDSMDKEISVITEAAANIEKDIVRLEKNRKLSALNHLQIDAGKKEIARIRKSFEHFKSSIDDYAKLISEKEKELSLVREELKRTEGVSVQELEKQIAMLSSEVTAIKNKEIILDKNLNECALQKGLILHRISNIESSLQRIAESKTELKKLQSSLETHQKVVEAFSSTGIPSLIVHSVLDDFQEDANNWLKTLHPGIQLQFVISKDNSKKQQEDTLDILYFIGGEEMEYKQLSGAQKMLVSLAIKLAIINLMNKKLGVSIKLMLLDEVDQPLDPGTAEIFADVIKTLQKDIKILAITHNPELKHKFSHAIVVDRDENNVSSGQLVAY